MTLVRTRRWRRALVTACLPYLLLSVFVDFLHLHPMLSGNAPRISVSQHIGTEGPRSTRLPDYSCAVCQWLRAGTGLQASVATGPTAVRVADFVAPAVIRRPTRPVPLTPDFRGPPLPLFV